MGRPARRGPGRPKNPVSRQTLLQAAGMAFAERGYAGASMSDIASRAGIQKASLFHHFPTKELLYMEVLSDSVARFAKLVEESHLLSDDPFLERLDRLTTAITDYIGGHPQTARLVLREFIGPGPFAEGPGQEAVLTILKTAVAFIAGGIEEGAIPEQDPAEAVMSLVGLHLVYFAAVDMTSAVLERDIFADEAVQARRAAIAWRARALLGTCPDR